MPFRIALTVLSAEVVLKELLEGFAVLKLALQAVIVDGLLVELLDRVSLLVGWNILFI